ncbi:MAG: hypothetical protein GXP61_10215, partial [Epsilonproteobacteria bacterium]|nr:hypothetical protein [Campylobacterota bacterium]
ILNKDNRNFLFEFELLSFKDFISILNLILVYPFKTLRLSQKKEINEDVMFNNELINDISSVEFDAFSRYMFGKNIAKFNTIKKIYSWSEFQVIERSFNYGIRTNNQHIKLIACQFYLNYETYFNTFVDDIDYDMQSSPHEVLVNGNYYILDRRKISYKNGVALRYKNIFDFDKQQDINNQLTLLMGSYITVDTKYMLESVSVFDSILFKNHPAVDIKVYGKLNKNIKIVKNDIYKLFQTTTLAIGSASGTCVEAIACGISVIIIASVNNLTANPLVEYGKGKIWDIAFSKDDIEILYNQLLEYRRNNIEEIKQIASWYKDNFFVEPIEENIVKVFELDKD